VGAIKAGYSPQGTVREYTAIHAALSCYYAGDFVKGGQLGYVTKVLGSESAAGPIAVKPKKRSVTSMMID